VAVIVWQLDLQLHMQSVPITTDVSSHQYIINNVQFVLGYIQEEYLKECLMTMGDRWSEDMVDDLVQGAPIKEGFFDYIEFTRMLKHGSKEKDDETAEL
jgi:hypothetical protein